MFFRKKFYLCSMYKTFREQILTLFLLFLPTLSMAQETLLSSVSMMRQKNMAKWSVPQGNYSGITPVGNNRYAVVSDKEKGGGFYLFDIRIDSVRGKVYEVRLQAKPVMPAANTPGLNDRCIDVEDVAFISSLQTLFIADEGQQKIREYHLDGQPTGRQLLIPPTLSADAIYPNYGFESLTYSSRNHLLWTITEQSIKQDGKRANSANPIPCLLRLYAFSPETCQPVAFHYYKTDAPTVKKRGRNYAFGVSAITALDDGSLLLMEREFYVAKKYLGSWVNIKIYRVSLEQKTTDGCLQKELVVSFKNRLNLFRRNIANYEGMCLGPKLADGRQAIILIADSQNNYGNGLFHLKDYIRILRLTFSD